MSPSTRIFDGKGGLRPAPSRRKNLPNKKSIYMAGPLNNLAWLMYGKSIASELEKMGYIIHLPQEECGIFKKNGDFDQAKTKISCENTIKLSDIIIANLDGSDTDSGTAYEVGFTVATNQNSLFRKTVIGYGTQVSELYLTNKRKLKNPATQYNAMFQGCDEIVWQNAYDTSIENLALAIHEAIMRHSA